jgi:sugar phosphate isomerase/epimerase
VKIGVQLNALKDYTQTPRDFASTVKKIARMGFTCVHVHGLPDTYSVFEIQETCAAHGLEIANAYASPDRIIHDTAAVIHEHRDMKTRYIGIESIPEAYLLTRGGFRRFITDFIPAARIIKDAGMQLTYHNHHMEFERVEDNLIFDYLIEKFPELDFVLDTFWVQAGGGAPEMWVRKLEGRCNIIHAKDYAVVNGKRRQAPPLMGNLNWDAIIPAAVDAKMEYLILGQARAHGEDAFEMLRQGLASLRNRFPDIGN